MRIPNIGEVDLLVPLHEGVFEQPMWSTFLNRLRTASGVDFAMLAFQPPGSEVMVQLAAGAGPTPEALRRAFGGRDPLQTSTMREGRVYRLDELAEAGAEQARAFVDEVLEPLGLSNMRAIRLSDASGLDAWLVLFAQTPIAAATASQLAALAPHMRAALRVLAALEREKARASIGEGAFGHLDFGWIAVDARCRILDADPQAERFMARAGVLRRGPYDRLTATAPAIDRQLTQAVKRFAAAPDARPQAINLSQDPWIDVLVSPVRVTALAGGSSAVAVVYFRGEQASSADRCQQLVDLFGLTQAEARFAWSIAQGLSIAEAADRHDLTIETARHYSKRIYAKTGASGQVGFMRLIMTSVVGLTVH